MSVTGRELTSVMREPTGGRIDHAIMPRQRAVLGAAVAELHREHALDLEAMLARERAIEELGAELVEAVPELVVRRREDEEPPAGAHHAHAIGERYGKVEDVLERAAVDDRVVALLEARRHRLVHVVGEGGAFVIRVVHGIDAFGAEEGAEEGLAVVAERRQRRAVDAVRRAPAPRAPRAAC
jgi:hypothetical protein